MPSITDIREYMNLWSDETYREALDYCYSIRSDKKATDLTVEVLKIQDLHDKKMNGSSIEKIPKKNEFGVDIMFSDIFWTMTEEYITPVNYIVDIVRGCINKNITEKEEVAGIVGRGLRSLPAFLREMDLAYKISEALPTAEVTTGAEQDVKDHTDILISINNQKYRVWSYQNTANGLEKASKKFCGKRGTIPDGYHLLFPINIRDPKQVEEVERWVFYSDEYVKSACKMIEQNKPDRYADILKRKESSIREYLKKPSFVYKEITNTDQKGGLEK